MPYRRTDKVVRKLAARHEAILSAAQALAAEGGMAAVQIAPVAGRAGIAAGTVYRYFPAKTELVAALVGALAESLIGPLAPAAEDAATAGAQVQALTLLALRALGLADTRARGLVVQVKLPGG